MADWIAERRRRFEAEGKNIGDMLPMLGLYLIEEPRVLAILEAATRYVHQQGPLTVLSEAIRAAEDER